MKTLVAFLAVMLGPGLERSAAAGAFTIGQVMSAPFASELVAARTGARVAWLENDHGRRNIWTAAAPDWKSRKLTNFDEDDGQEIAGLAWSHDGVYLLFARGGDFENGGENPNPSVEPTRPEQAIWRLDVAGATLTELAVGHSPVPSPKSDALVFLKKDQVFFLPDAHQPAGKEASPLVEQKGEQADVRWSPDGGSFAFVSTRSDHSFIGVYTLADKSVRYLDASIDRDGEPVWSPDGARLAFVRLPATHRPAFFSARREGMPWSIRVADAKTGTGHEIFRAREGPGSVFHEIVARQQIFWTAGDRIVFPWEQTGWVHLYSVALAGGQALELTPGDGEVEHVAAASNGKTIYFSTNIGDMDRRHVSMVDAAGTTKAKPVTSGESIEWAPAPVADDSATVYLAAAYNQKSHPAVRLANGESQDLDGPISSDFPTSALVKPQLVSITAADGLPIHGQLFLPPGDSGARHPALIFFHGGSRRQMLLGFHYMYYYSNAYAMNEYLASQGYVVLSVNYRSGIGYGLNFREALNYGSGGGSEFNDVIGAGLYLKSRPDVEPNRIGVWGGSYGGYLTAMALARASDLFAAGVDFHGVHDWSSLRGYLARGQSSGDPELQQAAREAARIAFESSPMASVDGWRSPVLLIHGDDDRNVEFNQTVMLVEALRKRRVAFEELIFPNEIHDFLLHRHWVQAYQATADFFARRLKEPGQSAAR